MEKAKSIIWFVIIFIVIFLMFMWYKLNYGIYNYVDSNTAQRGLFLKDTIYLQHYNLIGNSNGVIMNLDLFTRSDRHTEVIEVRVNENKFLKK